MRRARRRRPERCATPACSRRSRPRASSVVDHGDAQVWRWRPDRERPACAESRGRRGVREPRPPSASRAALAAGELALVLGGDCTVGLGTRRRARCPASGRLGLVYLDMHGDLNTPDSVPDGALDWMGVAHMLGEDERRARAARLRPARRRCSTTTRSCCSRTTAIRARRASSRRSSAAGSRTMSE